MTNLRFYYSVHLPPANYLLSSYIGDSELTDSRGYCLTI